ncbi:MAG: hypothetical protein ACKOC8_08770 [Pirellulales bacterium]
MSVHAIHLGNAWETPLAGRQHWLRRFGRPAGLVDGDRVLLVCERPARAAGLMLNGASLAGSDRGDGTIACDVTGLLRDRNELVVVFAATHAAPARTDGGRQPLPEGCGRITLEIVSSD